MKLLRSVLDIDGEVMRVEPVTAPKRGRVHKLDSSTEDDARGGTYEYAWIACRDPERWNNTPSLRPVKWSRSWDNVTCKLCLRRRR